MQRIIDAVEAVLDFLRRIPLSEGTVNDYKDHFRFICAYCESKGITWFSHSEAQTFTDIQAARCEDHQINKRNFNKRRKSAFLLAECMTA